MWSPQVSHIFFQKIHKWNLLMSNQKFKGENDELSCDVISWESLSPESSFSYLKSALHATSKHTQFLIWISLIRNVSFLFYYERILCQEKWFLGEYSKEMFVMRIICPLVFLMRRVRSQSLYCAKWNKEYYGTAFYDVLMKN